MGRILAVLKEDIEVIAKGFDEHVLIGVTSVNSYTEYLERVKIVKAETNIENEDFLVKKRIL